MKSIQALLSAILLTVLSCHPPGKPNPIPTNHQLWYKYPATHWNSQALHLGNGTIGASFFGGVQQETIALTEKSIWYGKPANGDWESAGVNPAARETLPKIRSAIVHREAQKADSLIEEGFFGSGENFGNFSSIGDLLIHLHDSAVDYSNYKRSLDLQQAIGNVTYKLGNTTYNREYFCSYPDGVLALRITKNGPSKINMTLDWHLIQQSGSTKLDGNDFMLSGQVDGNERPFEVHVRVENTGGSIDLVDGKCQLAGAEAVTLYVSIGTDYQMKYPAYRDGDPEKKARKILAAAVARGFDKLKERHLQDYQSLYNRVKINLHGHPEQAALPTNERFANMRADSLDRGYLELAFNLGRYLVIASSRPGTLPANLQGGWNTFRVAPWSGNYQSNINLQEIYWSCGPTNLMECQEAYVDWIEDLAYAGEEVARRVYGTDGWVSHTTGNIWGHAAPYGGIRWGMYPVGAAWHCQHLWEQFAFTADTAFLLNRAYPLLKGASMFWMQNTFLFDGHLITGPSVSAEHGALMTDAGLNPAFHDVESHAYHNSLPGLYQDMEMLWDLFTNTEKAALIAGDRSLADSLATYKKQLIPFKIGKHGQLQEWYDDIDDPESHHRHIAHLYAVAPGYQIHPTTTPELAEAAKVSLNMRGDGRYLDQELASGGNWSRAHRMWSWVRLMDGDRTLKIMREILTEQGFENGLTHQHADYHWERPDLYMEDGMHLHFQLDASASLPGCLAEMVLQSHMGEIHLLPALPVDLPSGELTGLLARGGITVDISWENNALKSAQIHTNGNPLPPIRVINELIQAETDARIVIE